MDYLIGTFDVDRVHADALRLLAEVGLRVRDGELRRRLLAGGGLTESGDRVLVPNEVVSASVQEIAELAKVAPEGADQGKIGIGVAGFAMFHVEPGQRELTPYSTEKVVEHTKLVDALREDRVGGSAPGVPQDVPPKMRQLVQYYLGCRHSRGAHFPPAVDAAEIAPYLMEMAGVMGHRVRVGVEPISPMTFEGGSIRSALVCAERLSAVELDVMPVMGVTAPLDWQAAWSQCAAETLGGYAFLRRLGFERVNPYFRLFPPSMRGACLAFGSPEFMLALLTRKHVRRFYGLGPVFAESLHTMAKLPDAQAAAEKSAQSVFAALMGHRSLGTAGSLAIDEIFSPVQLAVDMEIRNYVERMIRGVEDLEGDTTALVREGLDEQSFLMANRTLEQWREYLWLPRLFHGTTRAQWQSSSSNLWRDAWAFVSDRAAAHEYELDDQRCGDLESILESAEHALL